MSHPVDNPGNQSSLSVPLPGRFARLCLKCVKNVGKMQVFAYKGLLGGGFGRKKCKKPWGNASFGGKCVKNIGKWRFWDMPGYVEASSLQWAILGPSWGHLGPTWGHLGAVLGHLGAIWGPSWAILGPSWAILGPSWGLLGPSWGHLGPSWGLPGGTFGRLGAFFGASWAILGSRSSSRRARRGQNH